MGQMMMASHFPRRLPAGATRQVLTSVAEVSATRALRSLESGNLHASAGAEPPAPHAFEHAEDTHAPAHPKGVITAGNPARPGADRQGIAPIAGEQRFRGVGDSKDIGRRNLEGILHQQLFTGFGR